ncbi:GNAT family N-acetyltransferase [Fusobacterium nucleatum]|uniref:GNAT family N-acetyltransferase n=1 Tax=Fusobacterium nucleatum TaxID=851 RepID=UPI0015627F5F|nr:GNAT family N-acetyltransferase [Fusobacterium nucleatum]
MELKILSNELLLLWYEKFLKEDFVSDEIKPIENILTLIKKGRYEVYGVFQDDEMIAYASFWKKENINLVLLDYLGVSKKYRNQGIGSKILVLIKEMLGNMPYVVEAEIPTGSSLEEDKIRKRRIEFYERNGCKKVYLMATCGMKWQTLVNSKNEIDQKKLAKLHKELYEEKRTDVKIPVSIDENIEKAFWSK